MKHQDLIDKIVPLPLELKKVEELIFEDNLRLLAVEKHISFWENNEMRKITDEVDKDNKFIYTNDLKRKSELENRKRNDAAIAELSTKAEGLSSSIKTNEIQFKFLDRELKVLHSIVKLVARDIDGI